MNPADKRRLSMRYDFAGMQARAEPGSRWMKGLKKLNFQRHLQRYMSQ